MKKDNAIVKRLMLTKKKNLSSVTSFLPSQQTKDAKKSIDRLGTLLKANHNIKSLKAESCYNNDNTKYILKALANGHAGENLKKLKISNFYLSHLDDEARSS